MLIFTNKNRLPKLIWIENSGYWVYCCQFCQKFKWEKHEPKESFIEWGGIYG